jgi:hypothetical protein
MQTRIQGLNQEYAFVQQYYNYNDCSAFNAEIKALSDQEADLLARCRHIQDQSDAAQTNMQNAIQNTQTALNTSLDACTGSSKSINNALIAPPPPPDPPPPVTPLFYHEGVHYHFTNGTGGWSWIVAECIATTQSAAQMCLKTPNSPKNFEWIQSKWSGATMVTMYSVSNSNADYTFFPTEGSTVITNAHTAPNGAYGIYRSGGTSGDVNVSPDHW